MAVLVDAGHTRKCKICHSSFFKKFVYVLFKGISLKREEYFVSQIGWLEMKQSKAIRLKIGGNKSNLLIT